MKRLIFLGLQERIISMKPQKWKDPLERLRLLLMTGILWNIMFSNYFYKISCCESLIFFPFIIINLI
jgi:hypothetical protein